LRAIDVSGAAAQVNKRLGAGGGEEHGPASLLKHETLEPAALDPKLRWRIALEPLLYCEDRGMLLMWVARRDGGDGRYEGELCAPECILQGWNRALGGARRQGHAQHRNTGEQADDAFEDSFVAHFWQKLPSLRLR